MVRCSRSCIELPRFFEASVLLETANAINGFPLMAVLITGAAGFVALNTVECLLRPRRDVVGLDRIAPPDRAQRDFAKLPGCFTLIAGTVLSDADLRRALTAAPIEAVIHCAVITAGAAREKADPEGIVAVNVQ